MWEETGVPGGNPPVWLGDHCTGWFQGLICVWFGKAELLPLSIKLKQFTVLYAKPSSKGERWLGYRMCAEL